MKKIFAILLAIGMIFSFVACGDETDACDTCVDGDFDSVCDVCGEAMEKITLPPVPIN